MVTRDRRREIANKYNLSPAGRASAKKYRNSPRGKALVRKLWLRRYYNITPEEWDNMLVKQGGHCALCLRADGLHVDHCHGTGRFRGLLCRSHNAALGVLGDNREGILRALEYVS